MPAAGGQFILTCSLDESCQNEDAGKDPVPITFRYNVKPLDTNVTHVYRPKVDAGLAAGATLRPQSLGQVQSVFISMYVQMPQPVFAVAVEPISEVPGKFPEGDFKQSRWVGV